MTDHDEMTGCAAWGQWARDELAARTARASIARALAGPSSPLSSFGGALPPGTPPAASMSAIRVGPAWDEHVDRLRREYAELAVRRGHVRRYG